MPSLLWNTAEELILEGVRICSGTSCVFHLDCPHLATKCSGWEHGAHNQETLDSSPGSVLNSCVAVFLSPYLKEEITATH